MTRWIDSFSCMSLCSCSLYRVCSFFRLCSHFCSRLHCVRSSSSFLCCRFHLLFGCSHTFIAIGFWTIIAMTHRKKVDERNYGQSLPTWLPFTACACQQTWEMKQLNASKLIHKHIELRIHAPPLNIYKNAIKCFYQHLDLQCRLIYYKFTLLIVLDKRNYSHSREVNAMAKGVSILAKKRCFFFYR